MPSLNQIEFIKINIDFVIEPILIVGSKEYDFDNYNYIEELKKLEKIDILGIDIQSGNGVDVVVDICDDKTNFFDKYTNYFNTVICMQTLYAVQNPFKAAENIFSMMNTKAILLFSDVFVHKIHRIPADYWRFSYDAHKQIFNRMEFDDTKTKIGLTRKNILINLTYPLPELSKFNKAKSETYIEFIIRKIYCKIFINTMLNHPRLLPEISIFSISRKMNG
mgnify:CR=1 FL=1